MDENKKPQYQPERMNFIELTPYLESHTGNDPAVMVDVIISAMKDSGEDEDSLLKTRKLLEAKFGVGSWQDVIALHEETLKEQKAKQNIDGQLTTLINLTELAINDGDKDKARLYILQAQELLIHATAVDIENSLPQPMPFSGETILHMRRAEIERLGHWVF